MASPFSSGFSNGFTFELTSGTDGYSLLTLEQVKSILGITSTTYDAQLAAVLPVVTQWFEDYCCRGLAYVADQTDEIFNFYGSELLLTRFPIETVAALTINAAPQTSFTYNRKSGYLKFGPSPGYWKESPEVVVVYSGGYKNTEVPVDLARAFANCCAAQVGAPTVGVASGAAPIKQLGLGSGALSISFDTASGDSGTSGSYSVEGCPPALQPFSFTLNRYKAAEILA